MSRRATRYPKRATSIGLQVSLKEKHRYNRSLSLAQEHDSGGSYSMVAVAYRAKPIGEGYNTLFSPASLKNSLYPDICGLHAELALWSKIGGSLRGTSVVVAGVVSKSRSEMVNTLPCIYCAALMLSTGVRWIICNVEGQTVKASPDDLTIPSRLCEVG